MSTTILEEMKTSRSGKRTWNLRTLMGCFLFGGDDIDKKIKVLSGGESSCGPCQKYCKQGQLSDYWMNLPTTWTCTRLNC
jgi:hypothetical protein